jgi:hypothetical protein
MSAAAFQRPLARPSVLSCLLLWAALAPCATAEPEPAPSEALAAAVLLELQAGDVACYLILRTEDGRELHTRGTFEVCERSDLLGRRVTFTHGAARVLADDCGGDPECDRGQDVRLVTSLAPASGDARERPRFEGTIDHLERAAELSRFLGDAEGEEVELDLVLSPGIDPFVDGDRGPFFVLWVECDELPPGRAPGADACWGIEIEVRGAGLTGSPARLRGRFLVEAYEGPHQGLFAVPLRAVG